MNKEEIYNNYAIEQGFESLRHLLRYSDLDEIEDIINAVTDLVQEELKKKCAEKGKLSRIKEAILNTEIL